MRRLRGTTTAQALAAVLPTVVLATSFATTPAHADPVPPPGPSTPPAVSAPAAEQALDNATALLTGVVDGVTTTLGATASGPADATLALLDLRNRLPQLSAADRREARALLARPDGENGTTNDTPTGGAWSGTDTLTDKSTCDDPVTWGEHPFCVHWVTNAASKHYATDAEVRQTIAVVQHVSDSEIGTMRYRRLVSDGARGSLNTPTDGKLDVYLADIGPGGYFGYAVPEDDPVASSGYLVLENDFANFANANTSALEYREVTAAHEFFHLVQFAYDSYENGWLMESTATWMEEQVYDSINDNRNYIPLGSLRQPTVSLDTRNGGAEYGTWAFHQLYSEQLGAGVVRAAWIYAAAPGTNYIAALNKALTNAGWNLTLAFRQFGGGSLAPSQFWSEGSAYPSAQLTQSWTLTSSSPTSGLRSAKLNHLASAAYEFRPGGSLTGAWNLRLAINAPSTQSTAYVIVFYSNGSTPKKVPVHLDSAGNKTFSVPFRYGTVQRVALDVGNASTVDGRTTTFRATAWR
jgi:hypothetical protein